MKVRHPMGVLHSFSIKNIFFDKMELRLSYFDVANHKYVQFPGEKHFQLLTHKIGT